MLRRPLAAEARLIGRKGGTIVPEIGVVPNHAENAFGTSTADQHCKAEWIGVGKWRAEAVEIEVQAAAQPQRVGSRVSAGPWFIPAVTRISDAFRSYAGSHPRRASGLSEPRPPMRGSIASSQTR